MPQPLLPKSFASKMSLGLLPIALVFGLCCLCSAESDSISGGQAGPSAHGQFPDLNIVEVVSPKILSQAPNMRFWKLYGFALFAFLVPLVAYATWREHQRKEHCSARISEDRAAIYRQNPGAMRLVGASSYMTEPGEPLRKIDPVYDVQPRKKIEEQTSQTLLILPLLVFGGLSVCSVIQARYEVIKLERTPDFLNDWGPLLACGCFGIGIPWAIYTLIAESRERRTEIKLQTNSVFAQSHKSGFYQYHDRVLEELGFKKLETCLRTKYKFSFFYLSQAGNLLVELVEVGLGAGKPYFSLTTVTNDGKFLETNSVVKPRHEQSDVNLRLQRRSANHEDIIKALAEHDRLVAEFTHNGAVQEAQFTEERFERFLRWGVEKNAV